MISGAHVIVYSKNAEADRAFFRDILQFASLDVGHGCVIGTSKGLEFSRTTIDPFCADTVAHKLCGYHFNRRDKRRADKNTCSCFALDSAGAGLQGLQSQRCREQTRRRSSSHRIFPRK